MEISKRLIDKNLEFLLNGKMNNYDEYMEVKYFIKSNIENITNITFYFVNADSIDAYILGYILKLKDINKLNINIIVSNARLYNFLQYADFHKLFDVKIKEYE
ncbi:hypothetical protein CCY99_00765 [Helicobacter sp. 16-1353]|uniref:hypothetical protein n=1 Tax=Helicobacter sp. 16-1353 TaxID=2004996 RepID=UPI000DCC2511|nr:hypothetical protein [Helicobacter sp. 16-1353]RAX55264.1 hypothetical protein CCY99_00765 [Helicobacter sp. 16-1353]